jgi:hypothetical protein
MTDKRCPRCRLWNPATAARCDCGYDFILGEPGSEPLRRHPPVSSGELPRALAFAVPVATLALLLVLLQDSGSLGSGRPLGWVPLLAFPFAIPMMVLGAGALGNLPGAALAGATAAFWLIIASAVRLLLPKNHQALLALAAFYALGFAVGAVLVWASY